MVGAFGSGDAGELLAGRPGAAQPDAGPVVCVCFNVGVNTILDAITSGTARTVSEIGEVLSAGTNCGSCRPELNALLASVPADVAAE